MHLVLTGATGLVGASVLDCMLAQEGISRISILSRRPVKMAEGHAKAKVIIHEDFNTYDEALLEDLKDAHGCVWAQGVSQNAVAKEQYVEITHDYPLAAARAFSTIHPDSPFVFLYVSGEGATQSPGAFTPLYGRVKGQIESALLELGRKNPMMKTYNVRPGGVDWTNHPEIHPFIPKQALYKKLMVPPMNLLYKSMMTPTREMGRVMTELAMSKGEPMEGHRAILSIMDGDGIPPSSPPYMGSISPQSPPFFEPHYSAFTSKSSSPPPVFSSDDSRESVDVTNYESPRIHKNKRKGAWWDSRESAHNSPEVKKPKFGRNLDRNFDSGVYMLSDATDSTEDILPQHKSPFPEEMEYEDDHAIHTGVSGQQEIEPDNPCYSTVTAVPVSHSVTMSETERHFNSKVDAGLNDNRTEYNFSYMNLRDSHISRIRALDGLVDVTNMERNSPPPEMQYRQLNPELRIFLNNNRLHRLVPAIYTLEDLTHLYLQHNEIEELPQEIRRLKNLKALNLSNNKLKHLPFDIINLLRPRGQLSILTTLGSEYLEPMTAHRFQKSDYVKEERGSLHDIDALPLDIGREEASHQLAHLYQTLATCKDRDQAVWRIRYFESWANSFGGGDDARESATEVDVGFYPHHPSLCLRDLNEEDDMKRAPRYIARTQVSYYNQIGTLLPGSPSLPSNEEKYPIIIETNRGVYGLSPSAWFAPPSSSRVSSLVTTVLTRSLQIDSVESLRAKISGDGEYTIPREAEKILAQAEKNAAGGYSVFRECHTCHGKYVVARAEWIEFWSYGLGVFLPLKVSVCSWGCVPPQMMYPLQEELVL
ncbi:hypothetical protein TW65_04250 [Stemphylium lycopersici]|uniref:Nucleoside-diphosphate-sugar epimerase n=1 Tax=Stemphylium lycopersici TaxID=183478 RepID=A0A364N3U0_STELY|nr:hypothetical protein TW65_04250 [Stemphylium lycopersici]RAR11080.1 nucleoside-diphosphate-sugar epimerase [Stemphylium lycopersici]